MASKSTFLIVGSAAIATVAAAIPLSSLNDTASEAQIVRDHRKQPRPIIRDHRTPAVPLGPGSKQLLRRNVSMPGREVIQLHIEMAPRSGSPWHSHPGEEIVNVLEGTLQYEPLGGVPAEIGRGEALFIPAGTRHRLGNKGAERASTIVTYLVQKGKPLTEIPEG